MEDMDVTLHFEGRHIYLKDHFLTDAAAASCRCQVIDRKQNECDALSDMKHAHLHYCDGYLAREAILKSVIRFFSFLHTMQERKYVLISQMMICRLQQGERQTAWLALTSNLQSADSGCSCDACAPTCKNTDFCRTTMIPFTMTLEQRLIETTPQCLDEWALLVFTHYVFYWRIKYQPVPCYLLDQRQLCDQQVNLKTEQEENILEQGPGNV